MTKLVAEMPSIELPSAGKHSSGTRHMTGYKIEVRTSYNNPTILGEFVIDNVWREIPVIAGATPYGINIPVGEYDRKMLSDVGLLSYIAAEAHRWAFLAVVDSAKISGALCIETRFVKVKYSYSYTTEEIGVSEPHESMSYKRDVAAFKPRYPVKDEPEPIEDGSAARAALDVVKTPTKSMLNAARDWSIKKHGRGIGNEDAIGCWNAMWEAAVNPPPQEE
jgi:hypothetical protein